MRPPLWLPALRDAGEHVLGSPEAERAGGAGERHPHDSIVGCRGEVGVDEVGIVASVGRYARPEQAALAAGDDAGHVAGDAQRPVVEHLDDVRGVAFAHEHAAAGHAEDRPRRLQALGDDLDAPVGCSTGGGPVGVAASR